MNTKVTCVSHLNFISPFSLTWPVILSRCKNNFFRRIVYID